ncbi:MAG: Dioxygenase large subunit [Conexibacter sp.]|nr:Dioxygenase large subunit [Conexibacter sp.]
MTPMANGGRQALELLVHPDRVHRLVYTDPALFAKELSSIFGTGWVYVAHDSELSQPGDFKTTLIGRLPVIVAQGDDGVLRVMFNRCSHRAATVCQQEFGNARSFRCGYHGWTFRNDGKLANPTFANGYTGTTFDPADFGLVEVGRVDAYRGLVFASLAASGPDLVDHLGAARPYLDHILDCAPTGRITVRSGVHRYRYPGNWKLQCENGVDGYHPSFVHSAYIADVPPAARAAFGGASNGVSASLGNGHSMLDTRPMVGQAAAAQTDKERHGINLLIFPNLQLIANQIRVIRPVAIDETEVDVYPYLLEGSSDEANTARLRAHEDFYGPAGGGGPDDVEIFRRVSEGLKIEAVPWVYFMRGLGREVTDGVVKSGHVTDEQPQRGFYARWLELMSGGGEPADVDE